MVVVLRNLAVILWYAMCVLSCVDTGLFVYPSLSRTLLPAACAMLLALVCAVWCMSGRGSARPDRMQAFALAWVAYILLHGVLVADAEQYRQTYLLGTLAAMVALGAGIHSGLMHGRHIGGGIMAISAIHVLFLLSQSLGWSSSGNPYFRLSGADENPNVTAIAMTISIPFVCRRIAGRRHGWMYATLLAAILLSVIFLRCRTAWLGIFCMLLSVALSSGIVGRWLRRIGNARCRYAAVLAAMTLTGVFAMACYTWKKDSADGRLFIWQRSAEMVASSPLGVGYGLFERNYNLYQSEYFADNEAERAGSSLATACGSAYNDILEHGVQGGLVGGLMFAGFLLLALGRAYAMQERHIFCTLLAVAVMSAVNSICYSVTPWLMTIAAVALTAGEAPMARRGRLREAVWVLPLILLSSYILHSVVAFTHGQRLLREYMEANDHDVRKAAALYPAIGTSEAYWRYMAECNETGDDDSSAAICYREALRYTSSPLLLYKAAACQERCGNVPAATRLLRTACDMLPGNLSLKYHLMGLYGRAGDSIRARSMAMEILSVRVRRETENAQFIRREAEAVLNE